MRHKESTAGTEHIKVTETRTVCGETVYGGAEIDTPETAARVADNLCERCRQNMDGEIKLLEMADEVNA